MSEQSKYLPWQNRVIQEHMELGPKIVKLQEFVEHSDEFRALSPRAKEQLERQLTHMWKYSEALADRMCDF